MQQYEHVDADGEVTERVQPAADSKNARALAAKAADPDSGWRAVTDDAPAPATGKGKRTPPAAAPTDTAGGLS